jgi:hypothetical protein
MPTINLVLASISPSFRIYSLSRIHEKTRLVDTPQAFAVESSLSKRASLAKPALQRLLELAYECIGGKAVRMQSNG